MKTNPLVFLLLLISLLMAYGCVRVEQTEVSSTRPAVTAPSNSPSPTQTHTVSTITPPPTLSIEAIRQEANYLLQANGGCQLPCIWKLMPGMSSKDRDTYFGQFGEVSESDFYLNNLYDEEFQSGSLNIQFIDNETTVYAGLTTHEKLDVISVLLLDLSAVNTNDLGVSKFGDTSYTELTQYYQLSEILSEYGMPSRILFAAWQSEPIAKAPYDPMSIVIIYDDIGAMIEYIFPSESISGELKGCPRGAKINLFTWSKDSDLSLEDIVSIKPGDEGIIPVYLVRYKAIEEVTSLSLEEFYQIFQNPEECITTPADLWPPS